MRTVTLAPVEADVFARAALALKCEPDPVRPRSLASGMMGTQWVKAALALVDVRVLGHLIVGGRKILSTAERGLLREPRGIVWLAHSAGYAGSRQDHHYAPTAMRVPTA